MANDKILSSLSLAMKAGQISSGEFAVEKSVKEGKAMLVIVAEDASDNTKKKMDQMTFYYKVPCFHYATKERLGRCIGKEYRSMVSVNHPGFSKSIIMQLENISISE